MRCVVVKPSPEASSQIEVLGALIAESLPSFIEDKYSVEVKEGVIEIGAADIVEVAEAVSKFSGVSYAALAEKVRPDFDEVLQALVSAGEKGIFDNERFSVKVEVQQNLGYRASDLQTLALSTLIGKVSGRGARPDEKRPDKVIYAFISKEAAYIFTHRYLGPGGLPSGASGCCLILVEPTVRSLVGGWLVQRAGFIPTYLVTNYPSQPEALYRSIENLALLRCCVAKRSLQLLYVDVGKCGRVGGSEQGFDWSNLAAALGVKAAVKEKIGTFSMSLGFGGRSLQNVLKYACRDGVNILSPASFLTEEELMAYAKKIGLQRPLPLDVSGSGLTVLDKSGRPISELDEAAEYLLKNVSRVDLRDGLLDAHRLTDELS
jgi:thiamine biosynthesis protein ThiI